MKPFSPRASHLPTVLALASLVAVSGCSKSEEAPAPSRGTSATSITVDPATQAAALSWSVKPGQRFEVHAMTHVEYVGADERILFSEMVDRTVDAVVREGKTGLELEIRRANSEVTPTTAKGRGGLARALEAAVYRIDADGEQPSISLAEQPPETAKIDAWQTALLLNLLLPPSPTNDVAPEASVTTESVLNVPGQPPTDVKMSKTGSLAGTGRCTNEATTENVGDCPVVTTRVALDVSGSAPAPQGDVTITGKGTASSMARLASNGALPTEIVLRYSLTSRVTSATDRNQGTQSDRPVEQRTTGLATFIVVEENSAAPESP